MEESSPLLATDQDEGGGTSSINEGRTASLTHPIDEEHGLSSSSQTQPLDEEAGEEGANLKRKFNDDTGPSGPQSSDQDRNNKSDAPTKIVLQDNNSSSQGKKKNSRKRKKKTDASSATPKSTAKNAATGTTAATSATRQKRQPKVDEPQKTCCHVIFDLVRYMAILSSLMMLSMQVLPLVLENGTALQIAVRCYLILFCTSFVLIESQIAIFQKIFSSLYNNWVLRGFMYTFIGIIAREQDLAVKVEDITSGTSSILGPTYGKLFASIFLSITTWIMISVGILYGLLGLLCMQRWYAKLDDEYKRRVEEFDNKKGGKKKEKQEKKRTGKAWYDGLE